MSSSEPLLAVEGLSAAWGSTPVLRSVSLGVGAREYFVLLGPNGSGKSTLLRCLCGLETPTAGRVLLAGSDVTRLPTHRRGIGLMFQEPALFAHRTVYENVAYGPLLQRRSPAEVRETVGAMVELLHLGGFEDRRATALSGGERQRVALARTLAARPRLVLLDEPFASIDPERKQELRTDFRRALTALGIAAIHVTHDREEGLFLADRLGLLFDGRLVEVGRPSEVYSRPRTERSARFLGYNIFRRGNRVEAVLPVDLRLGPEDGPGESLTVDAVGSVGSERLVVLRSDGGDRLESRGPPGPPELAPGDRVRGTWDRSVLLGNEGERGAPPKSP